MVDEPTDYDPLVSKHAGLTRRELLGRAAIGGIVLATPGSLDHLLAAPKPRRGGTLRVGMVGGGGAESLDPNVLTGGPISFTLVAQVFEGLADFTPKGKPYNVLARAITPNRDASVWNITLRRDVSFHNGARMTADDVVYSLMYILDPRNKSKGAGTISPFLAPSGVKKVGPYSVTLTLQGPNSFFLDILADRSIKIFPNGSTAQQLGTTPIGTGPFMFSKWTPGESALYVANPNYWQGRPFLDAVEIVSINDPTARLNALAAGQIDALASLDPSQVQLVRSNKKLALLNNPSGTTTCQYMQVDAAPFNDGRVRRAMKLLVDRPQMLESALQGYGRLGNDLFDWFDPDYDDALPQRHYDPDQAKALLKQAGYSSLNVTLYTSNVQTAMLESSTLFVEQAKAGGVTINLANTPAAQYYSGPYLKVPFACTNWPARPLVSQFAYCFGSNPPYPETHFKDPGWQKLLNAAYRTTDHKKRHELMLVAQQQQWNRGGYIIWGFQNNLDAISTKVHGIAPSVYRPLGAFNFSKVYIA